MININNYKVVDLTHILASTIPTWNGKCGFSIKKVLDYNQCTSKTKFCVQELAMQAGIGTHIDAPLHCFAKFKSVADIPLSNLLAAAYVIDVCQKINDKNTSDYLIDEEDILAFENNYEKIKANSFVIGYTGWSKFFYNTAKYRNEDKNGIMHFPGFSTEAAKLLIKRNVVGIGIDTLSPDGSNYDFPVHNLILSNNKFIIENLANCDLLPPTDAMVIALPLKIEGGTESPIRVIALCNK